MEKWMTCQTNKYISMDTYIINIYYYRITRKYMNEMLT